MIEIQNKIWFDTLKFHSMTIMFLTLCTLSTAVVLLFLFFVFLFCFVFFSYEEKYLGLQSFRSISHVVIPVFHLLFKLVIRIAISLLSDQVDLHFTFTSFLQAFFGGNLQFSFTYLLLNLRKPSKFSLRYIHLCFR